MFYQLVEEEVKKVASIIRIIGEFHIGMEPIKEFVYFYCIAETLQKDSKVFSIRKYYQKKVGKEKKLMTSEDDRHYERMVDRFNQMNFKNQLGLIERQEREKRYSQGKQQKGLTQLANEIRYKGLTLFEFQLDEFEALYEIKDKKMYAKENQTYKRIVSEKGYLHRLNFSELKGFYELLQEAIDNTEKSHKNILYYKLEKTLSFELIKSMLKTLHQCRQESYFDENQVITDLLQVSQIPLIADRQRYVELYSQLDFIDRQIWRAELQSLITLICYSIAAVQIRVEETSYNVLDNVDWKKFDSIYIPSTFKNNYKMKTDFSADDFKMLMKAIDKHNRIVREKAIEKIKNETSIH